MYIMLLMISENNLQDCLQKCSGGVHISNEAGEILCGSYSALIGLAGMCCVLKTIYHLFHCCHYRAANDMELQPILIERTYTPIGNHKEKAQFAFGMSCIFLATALGMACYLIINKVTILDCQSHCRSL